jgi:Lrp/AsnC family transcriptional regulator
MDSTDKAILKLLQEDATLSLDDIAIRIGASKTPIWNRIKRLRESGVISHQVAIVSPQAVGLDTCFFVLVKTSEHDSTWQSQFSMHLERAMRWLRRTDLQAKLTIY